MSEIKRTQGDWEEFGAFVISKSGVDICSTCNVNQLPLEEQIANAKFIASAPKLQAACRDALKEFEQLLDTYVKFDKCGRRIKSQMEQQLIEVLIESGVSHKEL